MQAYEYEFSNEHRTIEREATYQADALMTLLNEHAHIFDTSKAADNVVDRMALSGELGYSDADLSTAIFRSWIASATMTLTMGCKPCPYAMREWFRAAEPRRHTGVPIHQRCHARPRPRLAARDEAEPRLVQ